MKKNLWLLGGLLGLLGLTWLLTEGGWQKEEPLLQKNLREELARARELSLPSATLRQIDGVWKLENGDMARADFLEEWHSTFEQFEIVRTLDPSEASAAEVFEGALKVGINGHVYLVGDLTPAGEGFYFGRQGDPAVHVVDLNRMGSLAVADDNRQLQLSKYHRMRDMLTLPAERWRELRLMPLTGLGTFDEWRVQGLRLRAGDWAGRPWGDVLVGRIQAGLASLALRGASVDARPAGKPEFTWEFVRGAATTVWEFFPHRVHDVYVVWDSKAGRGYLLDGASSLLVRTFPRTLVDRPLSLSLASSAWRESEVTEGDRRWHARLEGEWRATPPAGPALASLLEFLSASQNFEQVKLLTAEECGALAAGAKISVEVEGIVWRWLPVSGGRVLLECQTGVALSWRLPLDSPLDFATLVP